MKFQYTCKCGQEYKGQISDESWLTSCWDCGEEHLITNDDKDGAEQ